MLLIVAALAPASCRAARGARAIGLEVLVEVHDRDELADALELGAEIVGINNRDLRDFSVDVGRTERLLGAIPRGVTVVSESGSPAPSSCAGSQQLGVQAVLVGETLMRAADPAVALAALQSFKPADGVDL